MVLTGVTILGMILTGGTVWFVVFVGLVGSFLYAMRSVFQAWAIDTTPKHLAGTGVALQFSITALGSSTAPAFFGMVADAWGIYTTFYAMAATIVLGNLLVYFVPGGDKK